MSRPLQSPITQKVNERDESFFLLFVADEMPLTLNMLFHGGSLNFKLTSFQLKK